MRNILKKFQGKTVLVTGDTGFKGAWLCYWLSLLGARVVGYALPPDNENCLYEQLKLASLIVHYDADIRDYEKLNQVVQDHQPEMIFHLAAQSLVRPSYLNPKDTFDINVSGSVNVLELVRKTNSVKALIYVTSDKCYKNKDWIWGYRENDELGGKDPYSASKAAAEIVFNAYLESFSQSPGDTGLASVSAGNVIGGGDWAQDRIMPDCMRALNQKQTIQMRNPNATRPWQHVLEPLYGYMLLALKLFEQPQTFSGNWNFGPDMKGVCSVKELVRMIIKYWGSGDCFHKLERTMLKEAKLLQLNCDKANTQLGWYPRWGLEKSIEETVNWYHHHFNGSIAPQGLCEQQINQFMAVVTQSDVVEQF